MLANKADCRVVSESELGDYSTRTMHQCTVHKRNEGFRFSKRPIERA